MANDRHWLPETSRESVMTRRGADPNYPNKSRMKMKFFVTVMLSVLCFYWITNNLLFLQTETVNIDIRTESLTFKNDDFVYKELNMIRVKSVHTNKRGWPLNYLSKSFRKTELSVFDFSKLNPGNNTMRNIDSSWNDQKLINEKLNVKNKEFNSPLSKTWDHSEDGVDEHGVYSLGLKLIKGKFILNGDVVRIMSTSFDYSNLTQGEWRRYLPQMEKHGLNTVTLCVDRNFTQDGIESLRKVLTMVQDDYLFAILEIKLYTRCCSNLSSVDQLAEEVKTSHIDAYLEKLIPAIEEFQVTRGGSIIAFLFSDIDEYSSNSEYINLFQYIIQRLRFHGIQELVLKTETPQNLPTYPFSQIALPIIKLDHNMMIKISQLLFDIQKFNKDFPLIVTVNMSIGSARNLVKNSTNISVNFISS